MVATHQVEEVEHVLTDLVFLDRGRIVFRRSMEEVETQYAEVAVHPDRVAAARALGPVPEREGVGRRVFLFEGVERERLAALGDVRTPSVADLFVAILTARGSQSQGNQSRGGAR